MKNSTDPKFILFGDSHAGALRMGADMLGVSYSGGSMFPGRWAQREFFYVRAGKIILNSKRHQRVFCLNKGSTARAKTSGVRPPVLSTGGFASHHFAKRFVKSAVSIIPSSDRQFVSSGCFEAIVESVCTQVLEFYRTLIILDWSAYAVLSPQRFDPDWASVARQFELVLSRKLVGMGVKIVDVRAVTTNPDGLLQERYARSGDRIHGNAEYGAIVVRRFLEMIEGTSPRA